MTETLYTIRVDEPVFNSGTVVAQHRKGDEIKLSFVGGIADNKAIWIPGIPIFELNQKGVFFCDKDGSEHFSALVGISQGFVPIFPANPKFSLSQRTTVSTTTSTTEWVPVTRSLSDARQVHPDGQSLVEFLNDIVRGLERRSGAVLQTTSAATVGSMALNSSNHDNGFGANTVPNPFSSPQRLPQWKFDNDKILPSLFVPLTWDLHGIGGSASSMGLEFLTAMNSWNAYSKIFSFLSINNPTFFFNSGEWDPLNFENDVALTDSATLKEKWGVSAAFEHGNNAFMAFGINNVSIFNSLADVDLIFNSAVDWTHDQEEAISQSGKKYFRSMAVHMLGLAMGRVHQTDETTPSNGRMSVMNHFSLSDRPLMHHPFLDDALSIRAAYPNQVQQLSDLGIYFFRSTDAVLSGPTRIATEHLNTNITEKFLGETILVDARLENLGTRPISPEITFWLSREPRRRVATVFLGSCQFTEMPPGSAGNLNQEPFRIPEDPTLVGKEYYILAWVENGDDVRTNNLASTIRPILIKNSTNIRFDPGNLLNKSIPEVQYLTISAGEKKRVTSYGFRQVGPAERVRWSMVSDKSFVIPASSGGILKSSNPSYITADFHVDATGLSPGTYIATNWLHLDPGVPIPMPLVITVPTPSLRLIPSPSSSSKSRTTEVLLGQEFWIHQTIINGTDAKVRYNLRFDKFSPPTWETTSFIYKRDREIRRFHFPEYSGSYPGLGYHTDWLIKINGDHLTNQFVYRPVRVVLPFTLTPQRFDVPLAPYGTKKLETEMEVLGNRSLTFEIKQSPPWLRIQSNRKSILVSPGSKNSKKLTFKVSSAGLGVRSKPYFGSIQMETVVKNSRSEPNRQVQWRVFTNISVALTVGLPSVRVTDPQNNVINNGLNPDNPNPFDFGSVEVGQEKRVSFVIANDSNVYIDNLRAEVLATTHLGPEAHFTGLRLNVNLQPKSSTTGETTTLNVLFAPKATGETLTSVRIYRTSQPKITLHSFYIRGFGTGTPSIEVSGNGSVIPKGGLPNTVNGTDFGAVPASTVTNHTFIIKNNGNAPLELPGTPPIRLESFGPPPIRFAATLNSPTTIQPGATASFDVMFSPEYQDKSQARVIIRNSDPASSYYSFQIAGRGQTPGIAPSAQNDTAITVHRTKVSIDVMANDASPDNDTLTIASVTEPANGTALIINSKTDYTPDPGFLGDDSFGYVITDGRDGTSSATVLVTVTPVATNHLGAVNDAASTRPGIPVIVDVLANDFYNPGATIELLTSPSDGEAVMNEGGGIRYWSTNLTKALPFTDRFTYRLIENDETAQLWSTGIVDVTVTTSADYDWVRQAGSNATTRASALVIDGEGHSHVAGYYHVMEAKFGGVTLPLSTNGTLIRNLYLAQFDSAGVQQSVHRIGESADADIVAMDIDSAGNRYLAGRFEGSIQLGAFSLDSGGSTHGVYLAKVAPSGNVLWAQRAGRGSSSLTLVNDLAVDSAGNSYVVGWFNNPDLNETGIIAVRYNASGQRQWAREATHLGLGSNPVATGVEVDSNGNAIVAGYFGGTLKFHTAQQISSSGGDDIFLASYTPVGGLGWFKRAGGSANEQPAAIGLDARNRIYVAGTYDGASTLGGSNLVHVENSDLLLAAFGTNGVFRWVRTGTGSGLDMPTDMAVDDAGSVSVVLDFFGSLNASGVVLTSAGERDVAALRYNEEGNIQWGSLVATGPRGDEYGRSIGIDPAGNPLVLGDLVQATINGQSHAATGGGSDLFLAKLGRQAIAGQLVFSPGEMFFGLDTIRIETTTLNLTNAGPRALTWAASSTNDWIFPTPASGAIPVNRDTNLIITIHPTNVVFGQHLGAINLQSSDPARTNVDVPLTLILENPPVLAFSPLDLKQDIKPTNSPQVHQIEIWNTGGDPLEFNLSSNASWLSFSTNSGIVSTGRQTIAITYDKTGLPEGNHLGKIIISGNARNTPQTVPVRLTISRFETGSGNALSTWTSQNPKVPPYDLHAVTHGNNRFLAVGEFGTALISSDGTNWTTINTGTNTTLRSVAAGSGGYIAVGDGGTIMYSADGTNWSARVSGTTRPLNGVGFANGIMVAAGDNGTLLTSSDATFATWTSRASGETIRLNGVDHGNGKFLITGQSGTLLTSIDGTVWTKETLPIFPEFRAALFRGGTYYLVGDQSLQSDDLTQWANPVFGGPSRIADIIFFANHLSSAGGTDLSGSASQGGIGWAPTIDLSAWNRLTLPVKRTNLREFANNGTIAVAVGESGRILTSTDAINWTDQNPTSANDLEGIAAGTSGLVAVGDNGFLLSSTNAVDWTKQAAPNNRKDDVYDVVFGSNVFVAATASGAWVSSNAIDWERHFWGETLATPRLAFGGGVYVVVSSANGVVRNSSTPTNWTRQVSGVTTRFRDVAYADGQFVAVGDSGTILVSSNSVDWIQAASGTTDHLRGIAYGAGTWVAVGYSGRVLTSADGVNWNIEDSGTPNALLHVIHAGGIFLTGGVPLSSPDGKVWSVRARGTSLGLSGAVLHQNHLIYVGQRGTIIRSGELNKGPPMISFASATNQFIESQGLIPNGNAGSETMSLLITAGSVQNQGSVSLPVVRSGKLDVPVSIDFRTLNGQATAGADYATNSGTLNFAAGESIKFITVAVTNDNIPEQAQDFLIQLENAGGGAFLEGIVQTSVTITDDDLAVPVIVVHPINAKVFAGDTAEFRVVTSGEGELGYQWQFNGSDLITRTNSTLTLNSTGAGNVGSYRARVSNTNGMVFSSAASLIVVPPFGLSSTRPAVGTLFETNGAFKLRVNSLEGSRVVIEGSDDLTNWFRLHTILSETNTIDFDDPFANSRTRRFYRVFKE